MLLMLRRFHRGRAMLVIGCRRSCHRAVIGFGTVQRFTLLPLGFVRLGRLFVLGVNGVVAHRRWRGCLRRTRGATARCPADILTAEGLAAFAALSSLQRLLDELTEHAGLPADRLCRRTRHLPYLPGLLAHLAEYADDLADGLRAGVIGVLVGRLCGAQLA